MADVLQFTMPSRAEIEEQGEGKEMAKQPSRAKLPWTEDEIDDLLLGVETYGAENWRLILEDPNFTFDQREVADLKYQ